MKAFCTICGDSKLPVAPSFIPVLESLPVQPIAEQAGRNLDAIRPRARPQCAARTHHEREAVALGATTAYVVAGAIAQR